MSKRGRRSQKTLPVEGKHRSKSLNQNPPNTRSGTGFNSASVDARIQGIGHVHGSSPAGPWDAGLLDRARTQWMIGDWGGLVGIQDETVATHPDRARLALLIGAARLQLGDLEGGRSLLRQAAGWGIDRRVMARLLIAGVHNTLGRASALLLETNVQRMERHFASALDVGIGEIALHPTLRLSAVAHRMAEISPDLGLPLESPPNFSLRSTSADIRGQTLIRSLGRSASDLHHVAPVVRHTAVHDLGMAWASNTVNTVIFRHHAVVTDDDYQFTAFYVDESVLRVVRRHLPSDSLETYDIPGTYNLVDAHNSISLGVDRDGHLHICYDHHGTQLRYRRALLPWSIGDWSDEIPMTGLHEQRVTYPCFIHGSLTGERSPLLLLYRDGIWNKGAARLKQYDEGSARWSDVADAVLSGSDQKPWTSNPYWNHPARGRDGVLHLSFVWRTHSLGEEGRINNVNIGYAKSPDNGRTWLTSRGRPCQVPMTQVNSETALAVAPGSNLINQCSMALDSCDRPHIVFYADDSTGIPQYQHLWFDGSSWRHQLISKRTRIFALEGAGTLQIPISRPEIFVDRMDQVFVLMRGDLTHDRMAVLKLCPPDYAFDEGALTTLWDEDLGHAEPIIDRVRWSRDGILTMLLQHNRQPQGDEPSTRTFTPVALVDFSIT